MLAKLQTQPDAEKFRSWVEHLRAVSLFEDLKDNAEALEHYARIMEERKFAVGAKMIEEGSASSEMFILIAGRAAVFKSTPEGDNFKVAIIDARLHAFFGEGGLISADVRSATIVAETECHCLVLAREKFEMFGNEKPNWTLPFYRRIANLTLSRLKKANTDLMVLYRALVSEIRGH